MKSSVSTSGSSSQRHRRGDRRVRPRPHRVRRRDRPVARVLVVVDEHALAALLLPPGSRDESASRRSTSRANASAQRRTSGNVQLGSIRQATWMPRLPEVFGQPTKPISSSTSRTTPATRFASAKSVPGCGSTSIRSSSGLSTCARREGHGWKSIVPEVRGPGDLRELGDAQLVRVAARRERDARDLDPVGAVLGHALLVDRLALGPAGMALQLRRPLVQRADDPVADRRGSSGRGRASSRPASEK